MHIGIGLLSIVCMLIVKPLGVGVSTLCIMVGAHIAPFTTLRLPHCPRPRLEFRHARNGLALGTYARAEMRTSYPLRQTRVVCRVNGWCVAIARIGAPSNPCGICSDISVVARKRGRRCEKRGESWDRRRRYVLWQAANGRGDACHGVGR
jgi:hypothetical protein